MTQSSSAAIQHGASLPAAAWRHGALLVFALAFAARAAIVVYANGHPEKFDYPDSRRYARVAENIAEGLGPIESPTNRTGTDPLYPLLLSPAWLIEVRGAAVDVFAWGRVVNGLLGLAALAAVMGIARRVGGDAAGMAAGLLFALDPILLFFHGLVLTEIAFTAFLWIAVYLLLRNTVQPSPVRGVLAGISLGFAALTRGGALPLALGLPWLASLGGSSPRRFRLGAAAFTLAGTLMTLCPAAARNHRLIGTWLPMSTGGGATLMDSFGPWADGGTGWERVRWPATPATADEAQRDGIYRDAALGWARAHPRECVRLAWAKFKRTWSITLHAPGYTGWRFAAIGWLTVAPVYVLAVCGAVRMGRRPPLTPPLQGGANRRTSLAILLTPAAYITLLHLVFVGSVRYRVPAMPGLFVLAACAVAPWLERWCGARSSPGDEGEVRA